MAAIGGDPVIVDCPANTWTKVLTAVTSETVAKLYDDDDIPNPTAYLHTYRATGGDVPTSKYEGTVCFIDRDTEAVSSTFPIDVYIMALNNDGKVKVGTAEL